MQRPLLVSRRLFACLLVPVALVLGMVASPATTLAQYYDVHSNVPFEQLTGLQFAGQRLYQGGNELNIYIDVAVFDTSDNAHAGLTALNAYYLSAYQIAGTPIRFEPVAAPDAIPAALPYHALLDTDGNPYADIALVQVQDGTTVLTAFVSNYAYDSNPEELAMEVAVAMLESILQVPVATATPAAIDGASVMARLPLETDDVPARYGMTYAETTEWFVPEASAEPTVPNEEATGTSDLLYGDAEGLVTVIGRTYYEPGEPSADSLNAYIEVAEFDSDDHAETGFANAEAALIAEIESAGLTIEDTDVDVSASESRAWSGTIEDADLSMAIIIARSDAQIVAVVTRAGDGETALDLGEDLAQATIDAGSGDGEVQFADTGFLTGGLWDKLPVKGDDVLRGMEPTYDEELYP